MNNLYLIPKTKLLPPVVGEDILQRPEILARLYDAATTKRLTLVSAQAGAGKTTAVASLHHAHPELALAWLSLDEDDNQALQFGTALLATIQPLLPEDVMSAPSVLQGAADNENALKLVMRALINDLFEHGPDPFILVLDDLHIITNPSIHQALDYLLEHLPAALHLVVTTRQDPPLSLSKLRARNQLAEVRINDLRFDKDEMASLLNDRFGLALLPDDLERLDARTEGWVAGIRLLTLSLAEIPSEQRSAFIDRFAQSHAFIFDYLMDEVLNQQEPIVHQFLLQTSILRELTPSLCAAVTGRSDSAQLLEQLQRRNLFLTRKEVDLRKTHPHQPSDTEPTYRYHDLFTQFLRQQLNQSVDIEQVRQLHKQAAIASPNLNRTIHHYVAGEWWDEAAEVIEEEGKQQLEEVYVHQNVGYWSEQLPADLLRERPWFLLFSGFRSLDTGQRKEADALFEMAIQQFVASRDTLGEAIALYGLNRYRENQSSDRQERLDKLRAEHRKHPFFVVARVSQEMAGAWIAMHNQQWHLVHGHVRAGLQLALKQGSIAAIRNAFRNFGAQLFFGDLALSEAKEFIDIIEKHYANLDAIVDTCLPLQKAWHSFFIGDLSEAEKLAIEANGRLDRIGGDVVMYFTIDHIIYFTKLAQGDYVGIDTYLADIKSRYERIESYKNGTVDLGMHVRLAWVRNQAQTAASLVSNAGDRLVLPDDMIAKERGVSVHEIRGIYEWSQGNLDAAEPHFKLAATLQRETIHTLLCTDNRLNLAMLYTEQGRTKNAIESLAPALRQWAKKEMPGVVLQSGQRIIPALKLAIQNGVEADFAQQVLELFGEAAETRPVLIPNSNEALTPREVDVLRLIVRGFSNQEIADELVVSLNTVKSHITRLLAKLNVKSRTQAAAKARSLGI